MVFGEHESYPEWDPVLQMIDQFYRENYPEYILTSMANYFNKREEAKMPDQGIADYIS